MIEHIIQAGTNRLAKMPIEIEAGTISATTFDGRAA